MKPNYAPYASSASCSKQNKMGIPPRDVNGGLYTGEPFRDGAPWANVPVIPDASYMIHYNLRSANPPADALTQYPGGERPGNNKAIFPGVQMYKNGKYGVACNTPPKDDLSCQCPTCCMSKYAYL